MGCLGSGNLPGLKLWAWFNSADGAGMAIPHFRNSFMPKTQQNLGTGHDYVDVIYLYIISYGDHEAEAGFSHTVPFPIG
mgnify:FL=1